ncbi:MAG: hypothetical protein JWR80_4043 [Bradyrhizobium sp.]|nr:hypothetical protein [Bradyrhizobium sp.]
MPRREAIAIACAAVMALSACGGSESTNIRESWGAGLAHWGLRPMYPMRENVYLGDVYLFLDNPCRGSTVSRMPQSMLLGAMPQQAIKATFEQFYGDRPNYPRNATPGSATLTVSKPTANDNKIAVQISGTGAVTATSGATAAASTASNSATNEKARDSPEADDKHPIFAPGSLRFTRLPMAALPDVKLYDYVGGTAGGLYGPLAFAFGGEKSRMVKVSAQQIETTELPASVFLQLVDQYKASNAYAQIMRDFPRLRYNLEMELRSAPGCVPAEGRPKAYISFINSVYYTRNLSFEFGEDSSFAAKLAASLPTTLASAAPSTPFNPPGLPANSTSTNPAQVSSQGLLTSLGSMSGGPGGGFSFAIGSSGNLALNQTFARPMAFATQHSIFEFVPYSDPSSGSGRGGEGTPPPIPSDPDLESPTYVKVPKSQSPPKVDIPKITDSTNVDIPKTTNPMKVDIPKM